MKETIGWGKNRSFVFCAATVQILPEQFVNMLQLFSSYKTLERKAQIKPFLNGEME